MMMGPEVPQELPRAPSLALITARRNLSNHIGGIPRSLRRARIGRTIVIFACGIAVYGRMHKPLARGTQRAG
jgi:hypothetical protein